MTPEDIVSESLGIRITSAIVIGIDLIFVQNGFTWLEDKIFFDHGQPPAPVIATPKIVRHCEILVRGLAHIGIISLVDEATGYQYTREKDELQKILKAYIAEELLPWQKTFPDIYYREIFRLNGWGFTVPSIKKRPGVVGTWTNKIVYEQLPKGVLKELKDNTPKSSSGNYTARFFQSLTPDIGNPHLQNQSNSVITLMQVLDNWKNFIIQFNKLVDRRKGQL
jgi:hypothetical protein